MVDWSEINEILKELPWNELLHGLNNEECIDLFLNCVKDICIRKIPKKKETKVTSLRREKDY